MRNNLTSAAFEAIKRHKIEDLKQAFQQSAQYSQREACKHLIIPIDKAHAISSENNIEEVTLLNYSITHNNIKAAEFLVSEIGVCLEGQNKKTNIPLNIGKKIFSYNNRESLSHIRSTNFTPLCCAIAQKSPKFVKFLLFAGVSSNHATNIRFTYPSNKGGNTYGNTEYNYARLCERYGANECAVLIASYNSLIKAINLKPFSSLDAQKKAEHILNAFEQNAEFVIEFLQNLISQLVQSEKDQKPPKADYLVTMTALDLKLFIKTIYHQLDHVKNIEEMSQEKITKAEKLLDNLINDMIVHANILNDGIHFFYGSSSNEKPIEPFFETQEKRHAFYKKFLNEDHNVFRMSARRPESPNFKSLGQATTRNSLSSRLFTFSVNNGTQQLSVREISQRVEKCKTICDYKKEYVLKPGKEEKQIITWYIWKATKQPSTEDSNNATGCKLKAL